VAPDEPPASAIEENRPFRPVIEHSNAPTDAVQHSGERPVWFALAASEDRLVTQQQPPTHSLFRGRNCALFRAVAKHQLLPAATAEPPAIHQSPGRKRITGARSCGLSCCLTGQEPRQRRGGESHGGGGPTRRHKVHAMPFYEAGVDLAGRKFRTCGNPRQKIAVGYDTERRGLGEGPAQQAKGRP